MALAVWMQRQGDGFFPAEEIDRQCLSSYQDNQPVLIEISKVTQRDMDRHRKYWGGLVKLVAQHWEPKNKLVLKYERSVLNQMIDFVTNQGQPTDALSVVIDAFIGYRVKQAQALHIEHSAKEVLESIHEWIKEEAGYFDLVVTPTGVKRKVRSISFAKMPSQEAFEEFYSKAFDVAWRYVLVNVGYKSQEEAQEMALRMLSMR